MLFLDEEDQEEESQKIHSMLTTFPRVFPKLQRLSLSGISITVSLLNILLTDCRDLHSISLDNSSGIGEIDLNMLKFTHMGMGENHLQEFSLRCKNKVPIEYDTLARWITQFPLLTKFRVEDENGNEEVQDFPFPNVLRKKPTR